MGPAQIVALRLDWVYWICEERRGLHLRELVKEIPLDRLMIETAAPFLTPRNMPMKPKDGRHEPAFLIHVLKTLADCLGKQRTKSSSLSDGTS